MRSVVLCAALLAAAASVVVAAPQGFLTDLDKATQEAAQTGKSVFVYFNLSG
jgi:hypothetical protein